MSSYLEARQQALETLQNLPGDELRHAVGAVNPYLEDSPSSCRVQQSLAFVAEVFLHGGDGDNGHVAHDMTADALEGLGWILRACHESLDALERLRVLGLRDRNVEPIRK